MHNFIIVTYNPFSFKDHDMILSKLLWFEYLKKKNTGYSCIIQETPFIRIFFSILAVNVHNHSETCSGYIFVVTHTMLVIIGERRYRKPLQYVMVIILFKPQNLVERFCM